MRKRKERSQIFWLTIIALALLAGIIIFTYFASVPNGSFLAKLDAFRREISIEFLGTISALIVAYIAYYLLGLRSLPELDEERAQEELSKSVTESQKQYDQLRLDLSRMTAEIGTLVEQVTSPEQRGTMADEVVESFDNLRQWTYRGHWQIEEGENGNFLEVNNSEIGGYLKPCLWWTDYEFSFETKIIKDCSSWIVRASDHLRYVMLQCGQNRINPHLRRRGFR